MPVDNVSLNRRGEPHQQVVKHAIHWLLRLRNNSANARLRQQCEVWRAEHHEHELAWQRVQSLQAELSSNLRAVPGAQVAFNTCLLYTSPSPRDATLSRMPSSA